MENTFKELVALLRQHDELGREEGGIKKNKVQELARKNDERLIELLLSNPKFKQLFFVKVKGALVFNKEDLISLVYNKNFLKDSYTRFAGKIGLAVGDDALSRDQDVVLNWPHKECMLEGGMTKEEKGRKEIFWNEVIAPEHITRLKSPKAFTNGKRVTGKGEEKLSKINRNKHGVITDNLIIKGNNLLALYSLHEQFRGKVKLIYIDPPYNTPGEANVFTYNNSFNHATWLTFMKNRLEAAKGLLREDGFVAIAIDAHELFYLGVLADEVFGSDNRLGIISVKHHPAGRTNEDFLATTNEYMLIFAKNKQLAELYNFEITDKIDATYNKEDSISRYKLQDLMRKGSTRNARRSDRPKQFYPIYVSPDLSDISIKKKPKYLEVLPVENGNEWIWSFSPSYLLENIKEGNILAKRCTDDIIKILCKKRIIDYKGKKPTTTWEGNRYNAATYGTRLLSNLLNRKVFSYPKSLYTLIDVLKITTADTDIILDFFAGSGTTGHAAVELNEEDGGNRQFIMVEQLDGHIDVCAERCRKVLQEKESGDDFIYMELAEWNQKWVKEISNIKNNKEAIALWNKLKDNAFLSYKIDIKKVDRNAGSIKDLSLEEQKKFLQKCLDANHLYINYSEMEADKHGLSQEDKAISKSFYRAKYS